MNASNAKDFLPLVQALADGKTIQGHDPITDQWKDLTCPAFDSWGSDKFRIKPEPREFWVGLENGQVYDCKPSKETILNMGSGIIIKVREILD